MIIALVALIVVVLFFTGTFSKGITGTQNVLNPTLNQTNQTGQAINNISNQVNGGSSSSQYSTTIIPTTTTTTSYGVGENGEFTSTIITTTTIITCTTMGDELVCPSYSFISSSFI
ncbi:hypothetical protein [Candidatus Nanopusillus massiliensis]|uniref:hypothetical protein n=1 Tax=Candidatus Nanopusillus massiliensis TaxID=2897163 RepID=UPI001E53238C|nr:hypothetical protein [Candidatus Nanopusillus massiliensis]